MNIELHIHTTASDGYLNWDYFLKRHALKHNLILGITDHNTIKKALHLKSEIPIIIGEEISALLDGRKVDVIGLFLQEEIKPLLPLEEVLDQIKSQGAISYAPHPLDMSRHAMGMEWAKKCDIVEIFNAKTPPLINNKTWEVFKDVPYKAVGSDAHFFTELGLTQITMPDIDLEDPKAFLAALKKSQFTTSYPNPLTKIIYKTLRTVKKWKKSLNSIINF